MDERLRKELLRSELKERNNGKKIIRCKYRPKYPDSAEREYVRLINAYMTIEKEVLMKYIPEIKQILNDGTQLHTDSKKDNEKKRRTARFSALDNTIVRLTILFKTNMDDYSALKGSTLVKGLAGSEQLRFDSVESATVFFARELDQVKTTPSFLSKVFETSNLFFIIVSQEVCLKLSLYGT